MTITAAPRRMFIDGDWAEGSTGDGAQIVNPAT